MLLLYVSVIHFFEHLCRTHIQQNSFIRLKAIPVMNHHHKSLLRYNLKELLTQEFQTLLSKRKQRSWDHDTQSAAVTQLWTACFSNAGLSGSRQDQIPQHIRNCVRIHQGLLCAIFHQIPKKAPAREKKSGANCKHQGYKYFRHVCCQTHLAFRPETSSYG